MKPLASLSLDLDNRWSYLKTRGIDSWRELPSYLDLVVPRFLRFFEERDLRVTVFVVGQDAALPQNRDLLRRIADAGHEIANHSFHHEPWLHLYSEEKIEEEISRTEEAIEQATGQRTVGFRGPGYSLSESTLRVLVRRGYRYDASTLPTYIGPLARAYYFFRSPLDRKDRERRAALFGTWRDGRRPLKPFRWSIDGQTLLELPVTVMPVLRSPFHPSYLLYLSSFSPLVARAYFRTALTLCRCFSVVPSLLLHPLDFLDADELPDLAFFPAMRTSHQRKLALLNGFTLEFSTRFQILSVGALAATMTPQHLALHTPSTEPLP